MIAKLLLVNFLLGISLALVSCSTQKHCTGCGSVLFAVRLIHKGIKDSAAPDILKDRKFWYKDSLVIAEGRTVYFNTITTGNIAQKSAKMVTDKYTFIDLRKKWFYVYQHFSDTAKIVEQYPQPDTGEVKGGWKFFSREKVIFSDSLRNITDTTIEGIAYKRARSSRMVNYNGFDQNMTQIGYMRCDKKGSPFVVDNAFSAKIPCPFVRVDRFDSETLDGNGIEWVYLPDKLTARELKVFAAWEKNEEQHPVKK